MARRVEQGAGIKEQERREAKQLSIYHWSLTIIFSYLQNR